LAVREAAIAEWLADALADAVAEALATLAVVTELTLVARPAGCGASLLVAGVAVSGREAPALLVVVAGAP
jgi:hypothetical protein